MEQLRPDPPPHPLADDLTGDIVIVGAGIAGVATAYFTLRDTDRSVVLLERTRVGRGATGHNAGQLTTYFERPLSSIAAEFGEELALAAQAEFDVAPDLVEAVARESGADVRIERFIGHMGMYTLAHLEVHLLHSEMRRRGGLAVHQCVVSEEAEYLHRIPPEFAGLYSVVPQERVCALLGLERSRYTAVLSEPKGCANSAQLVQHLQTWLLDRYPDRFRYFDHTTVERVRLFADAVELHTNGHTITAARVVMCTNGFADHVIENLAGEPIETADHRVEPRVGFMTAFVEGQPRPPAATSYILNEVVGGSVPYVYVTRRTYDRGDDTATLTCLGGPDAPLPPGYSTAMPFPRTMFDALLEQGLPLADPSRSPEHGADYAWHGPMGYTPNQIRLIGAEPRNPALLYNLGCNGVGFLPSVVGGRRIARLLAGEQLPPSIFDPR